MTGVKKKPAYFKTLNALHPKEILDIVNIGTTANIPIPVLADYYGVSVHIVRSILYRHTHGLSVEPRPTPSIEELVAIWQTEYPTLKGTYKFARSTVAKRNSLYQEEINDVVTLIADHGPFVSMRKLENYYGMPEKTFHSWLGMKDVALSYRKLTKHGSTSLRKPKHKPRFEQIAKSTVRPVASLPDEVVFISPNAPYSTIDKQPHFLITTRHPDNRDQKVVTILPITECYKAPGFTYDHIRDTINNHYNDPECFNQIASIIGPNRCQEVANRHLKQFMRKVEELRLEKNKQE